MSVTAIIVAAGRGVRLGGDIPKQYQPLGGLAVLRRTAGALMSSDQIERFIPVIGEDHDPLYEAAMAGLEEPRLAAPVRGGFSRAESVLNGLLSLASNPPRSVLIHDAARPFIRADDLKEMFALADAGTASILAEPVVASDSPGSVSQTANKPHPAMATLVKMRSAPKNLARIRKFITSNQMKHTLIKEPASEIFSSPSEPPWHKWYRPV